MPTSPVPIPAFGDATEFTIETGKRWMFICEGLPICGLAQRSIHSTAFIVTLEAGSHITEYERYYDWLTVIFPRSRYDAEGFHFADEDFVFMKLMAQ